MYCSITADELGASAILPTLVTFSDLAFIVPLPRLIHTPLRLHAASFSTSCCTVIRIVQLIGIESRMILLSSVDAWPHLVFCEISPVYLTMAVDCDI